MMMENSQAEDSRRLTIHKVLPGINYNFIKKIYHELVEAISDCDDGQELSVIFKSFLIDDDELQSIYSRIYSSLQEELVRIGSYIVEPYESVVNGLSLKKNHIDLEIYCSTAQYDANITNKLSKVLESSKHFSKVEPDESHPIIKCVHLDTEYSIDISISETNYLHSIDLINQLKQADKRINELMLFIKIWFKSMHIYNHEYMSKHCLMTLIVFYLQNTDPPVLPSIKTIQQTAQQNIINGIQFGLNSRCIPVNPTQNIHQMIKGFFEFYSSLDFEKVIIAPYLGKTIKKVDFLNKVFKYPEYEAQMGMLAASSSEPAEELDTNYPVCVQEMFYLNRNIANRNTDKSLTKSYFEYLKTCISIANKKCCESKISIKNLYKSLLVNIIEELNQEHNVYDSLAFDIIPLANELKSLAKFADQPLNMRKLWAKAYIAAIPEIIRAIYKIDIKLQPPPTGNFEFKKIEDTEELPLPFEWSILSSVDLWTGRDMKRSNATFMEDQLEQTEKLYAERIGKSEFSLYLAGSITITITENFGSLHIAASSKMQLGKMYHMRRFFRSLKWFMRTYNLRHRVHLLESQLQ